MSDQQDIFNIRKQMSSADHEVMTVSRNIVTVEAVAFADLHLDMWADPWKLVIMELYTFHRRVIVKYLFIQIRPV